MVGVLPLFQSISVIQDMARWSLHHHFFSSLSKLTFLASFGMVQQLWYFHPLLLAFLNPAGASKRSLASTSTHSKPPNIINPALLSYSSRMPLLSSHLSIFIVKLMCAVQGPALHYKLKGGLPSFEPLWCSSSLSVPMHFTSWEKSEEWNSGHLFDY